MTKVLAVAVAAVAAVLALSTTLTDAKKIGSGCICDPHNSVQILHPNPGNPVIRSIQNAEDCINVHCKQQDNCLVALTVFDYNGNGTVGCMLYTGCRAMYWTGVKPINVGLWTHDNIQGSDLAAYVPGLSVCNN